MCLGLTWASMVLASVLTHPSSLIRFCTSPITCCEKSPHRIVLC